MTQTLSINIPDHLAKASKDAANKIGISRTEFIRRAIAHEIKEFQSQLEMEAMVNSMAAMKQSKSYLKVSDEMMQALNERLPKDKNKWWRK